MRKMLFAGDEPISLSWEAKRDWLNELARGKPIILDGIDLRTTSVSDALAQIMERIDFKIDVNLLSRRRELKIAISSGRIVDYDCAARFASPQLLSAIGDEIAIQEREFTGVCIPEEETSPHINDQLSPSELETFTMKVAAMPEFSDLYRKHGKSWKTTLLGIINRIDFDAKCELMANKFLLNRDDLGNFIYPGDINLVEHHMSKEISDELSAAVSRWLGKKREEELKKHDTAFGEIDGRVIFEHGDVLDSKKSKPATPRKKEAEQPRPTEWCSW